jgi:N-acetyl-anhydromuramyl-L-alanine amidase AmpD
MFKWFFNLFKKKKDATLPITTSEIEITMPKEEKNLTITDVSDSLPWNTNGQRWNKRKESQIKRIVIHQSLGTKTVKDTNTYCIKNSPNMSLGRGMPKIPYHYFIEPNGKIYKCNKHSDLTSHVKNMNTTSLAICLGGFYNYIENGKIIKGRDGDPPEIQIQSLEWLTNYLIKLLKLTTKDVYTHDELQGKTCCPGTAGAIFVKNLKE